MSEAVVATKRLTLYELLDRLLETGVVADGKILLSVADVDLIYLGVRLVLASVGTLEQNASPAIVDRLGSRETQQAVVHPEPTRPPPRTLAIRDSSGVNGYEAPSTAKRSQAPERLLDDLLSPVSRPQSMADGKTNGQPRLEIDPEKVERGLAKLVLTIVELLRRLMESQAVRRMDQGTLTDEEIERLGQAFSLLEARMEDLKKVFGLEDEELNLDLGPVGKLM